MLNLECFTKTTIQLEILAGFRDETFACYFLLLSIFEIHNVYFVQFKSLTFVFTNIEIVKTW